MEGVHRATNHSEIDFSGTRGVSRSLRYLAYKFLAPFIRTPSAAAPICSHTQRKGVSKKRPFLIRCGSKFVSAHVSASASASAFPHSIVQSSLPLSQFRMLGSKLASLFSFVVETKWWKIERLVVFVPFWAPHCFQTNKTGREHEICDMKGKKKYLVPWSSLKDVNLKK